MIKKYFPFLIYFSLIFYMLLKTPLVSDEFSWILLAKEVNFKDLLLPKGWFLIAPVEHYLLFIWCRFFDIYNLFMVNLFKVAYVVLSFYLIVKFFSIFLNKQNTFLVSFLFIFFPSHDTTVFCYEGIYATLTISFCLYSFYLAYYNKLFFAFIVSLIASFTSYASVPVFWALFLFFVLNKEFKKGAFILVPNIFYSFFYIVMSRVLRVMKTQIPDTINIYELSKQFILQIITFIDSILGPSMWLKIYYSFSQLTSFSVVTGIIIMFILCAAYKNDGIKYNRKLIICFAALLLFSFMIFGVTGMYPQLAFNLGNRVTIYGSLLVSYLLVLLPVAKKSKIIFFGVMLFTILGISDHWKAWNVHQQKVISNIKNNENLKEYNDNRIIYVSGNQFSKYGPVSHIEFFSENWVIISVFSLVLKKDNPFRTINNRHIYTDGYLIDTKYNSKDVVKGYIDIYDSESDKLLKLKTDEINGYIKSLPSDNRHWIQLIDNKFLKNLVEKLMPRLKYAL